MNTTQMHNNQDPYFKNGVLFEKDCFGKMLALIENYPLELGWFLTISDDPNTTKIPTIKDIVVLSQRTSPGTTEIDAHSISQFYEEKMKEPDGLEFLNSMRAWGHSHVNMPASPSGQDNIQMKEFAKQFSPDKTYRLIGNKQHQLRIDIYDGNGNCIESEVNYRIIGEKISEKEKKEYQHWALQEIKKHCHDMSWKPAPQQQTSSTFKNLWNKIKKYFQ